MSDFKIEVQLEQYTPLLHFQGREAGACLRASEVKPMLDRFVLNYLNRQGCTPETFPPDWLDSTETKNGKTPALRYKMRFWTNGAINVSDEIHPLYFGDMGKKNIGKIQALTYQDGVSMSLLVLMRGKLENSVVLPDGENKNCLKDILEALLPAFFALHCFGTRSNKGFGSFGVKDIDIAVEQLNELKPSDCLRIYELSCGAKPTERLDDIYVLSSLMKGGMPQELYYKGCIFGELPKDVGSEKAFIKHHMSQRDYEQYLKICSHKEYCTYDKWMFIRAMLGLTDGYTYLLPMDDGKIKPRTYKVTSCGKSEEIKRFANPIRFKPNANGLLMLVYQIPTAMLDAEFDINGHVIHTPKEFDIIAFTEHFLHKIQSREPQKVRPKLATAQVTIKKNRKRNGSIEKYNQTISFGNALKRVRVTYPKIIEGGDWHGGILYRSDNRPNL